MSNMKIKEFKQNKNLAMQGLATQVAFALICLASAIGSKNMLFGTLWVIASAWLPVWWTVFTKYNLIFKEHELSQRNSLNDWELQDLECVKEELRRLNGRKKLYIDLIFGFFLFISGTSILYQLFKTGVSLEKINIQIVLTLASILAFISLLILFYFSQLTKNRDEFNSGMQGLRLFSFSIIVGVAMLVCKQATLDKLWFSGLVFLNIATSLVGVECILKRFLDLFRPTQKGERSRPAYESYMLECLKEPTKWKDTFKEVVNHQLGFEATQTSFFRTATAMILPFILFSMILMFILSTVTIINPAEQGVVLSFGNMTGSVLEPGLHFVAPYPFNIVKKMNVCRVRRVFIGSHKPSKNNGEVFKKNVPLLWTNNHGVTNDELLIIAPPIDLMNKTNNQGEKEQVPSISLASMDIMVEYRIKNIVSFLKSSVNPDEFFKQISETTASRALFQYDIDTLFCQGRRVLPETLKKGIQTASDKMRLGVKVLNVEIGGVHPPQQVADAFHETVSAEQENKTVVQLAKQYRSKIITEAVGSANIAEGIFKDIQNIEKGDADSKSVTYKLLHSTSGKVSQLLSQAVAYKWQTETSERGKAERFKKELMLYKAAPKVYLMSYYMSVLEKGLSKSKKYMLVGDRKNLLLRFNFADINSVVPDNDYTGAPVLMEDKNK